MSDQTKVNVYILKVDAETRKSDAEEWIMLIQNVVVATGTWMTSIEVRVEGILKGMEIANVNTNVIPIEIKDDNEYMKVAKGEIDLESLAKLAGLS